jgi:hypothetical protein
MKPYVSGIERVECIGGGGQRIAFNDRVIETRIVATPDGGSGLIPTSFACPSGMVRITETAVTIRVAATRGHLELSAEGVRLPDQPGERLPYTGETVHRVARLMVSDQELQNGFAQLNRDFTFATFEYAAATGTPVLAAVATQATTVAEGSLGMLIGAPVLECTVERLVSTVVEEIWGWVETITTVLLEGADCLARCPSFWSHPWESSVCAGACAVGMVITAVEKTWGLVEKLTHEIVKEVAHCVDVYPDRKGHYKTPYGSFPGVEAVDPDIFTAGQAGVVPADPKPVDPAVLGRLFEQFRPLMECLAGGTWNIEKIDLGIDVLGATEIPYGIRICVDGACVDKILAALSLSFGKDLYDLLSALFSTKGVAGVMTGIVQIPWLNWALTRAAAALGLSLEVLAGVLIAFVIELAYQTLAVVGQIKVREFFGQSFAGGACLHHPCFVIAGVGVVASPLAALALALNTPIIITPA